MKLNRTGITLGASAIRRVIGSIRVAVHNGNEIFASLLVFGMFVVVLYGTVARYLPLGVTTTAWVDVTVRLFLAWLTFFVAASLVRERSHLTLDVVVLRLSHRLRLAVTILADLVVMGLLVVIAKDALFLALAHMHYIEDTLGISRAAWPLSVFAGAVLMLCYLIGWLIKNFREVFQKC